VLVALFGAMAAVRLYHLHADPPTTLDWSGGVFFDEGMLAHGARNRVLFGRTGIDDWNDFFISPVLAYIKWAVLAVLGVGIVQLRLIPVAFSLGILLLSYTTARRACGWRVALLTVSLLGFSYLFVMFNRIGLTETSVLFFMSLACFAWCEGFARMEGAARFPLSAGWLFGLAGASTFTSYVFKSYPAFLIVPFVALGTVAGSKDGESGLPSPRLAWLAAAAMASGMLAIFVPWYACFYTRHHEAIRRAMDFYETQSLPRNLHDAIENVCDLSFFRVFFRDPALLYLSFGYLGVLLHERFHHPERLVPYEVFVAVWLATHFAFDALLNYTPVRYHVPAIPPMYALAACAALRGARLTRISGPGRLRATSIPFLWLWLALLLSHIPLVLDRAWLVIAGASAGPLAGPQRMLACGVLSGVAMAATALAGRRATPRSWRLRPGVALLGFAILPLGWTFAVQARDYARWALHPLYRIGEVSRTLEETLDHAWIAGLAAPELCFETHHHPLHVHEGFFNDRDLFGRFPVTHLLLDSRQREQSFYYRSYPEQMRDAVLLDAFPISYSNFFLMSVVEPKVEALHVDDATPTAPGALAGGAPDAFAAHVSVLDPARGQPRTVRLSWALVPETPPGEHPKPPIVGEAPDEVRLAPGETREIALAGTAPPGRYWLTALVEPPHQAVLQGRFFDHQTGLLVDDPLALDGLAWKSGVAANREAYLAFGPYLRFGPGRFRVGFRLRAGPAQHSRAIARIEIARGMGRGVLASRELAPRDFPEDGGYRDFVLEYFHDQDEGLEFRVLTFCTAELWLDQVSVETTPGTWADQPIELGG